MRRSAEPMGAASGSTCTASAGVPRQPFDACPRRFRVWHRSGLPPSVEALTRLTRGLVLIGGATGSGKTTTLAALVNEINLRDERHIITIEDPIEYEHQHARSLVEQVEIGIDAPDFATALRAALRQAPDVIVVGEMRDPRDDASRAGGGRDRTSRVLEPAHDRRGIDCRPRRRLLSALSGRTPSVRSWRWHSPRS